MDEILFRYLQILSEFSSATKTALNARASSNYKTKDRNKTLEEAIKTGLINKTKILATEDNCRSLTVFHITEKGREELRSYQKHINQLLSNQASIPGEEAKVEKDSMD